MFGATRRKRLLRRWETTALHRVGVDGQLGHHLLHRRQLVAFPQQPQPEGLAYPLDDLEVGGHTRAAVPVELGHGCKSITGTSFT